MSIFAIADLHLSFNTPRKGMDIFGENWKEHASKIEATWKELITKDDLILVAGDISWAMNFEQVEADFHWIDQLPGTKVIIKGNHDYWWTTLNKVREKLPPSILAIQSDALLWNDIAISGTRLWDTQEFSFKEYIDLQPGPSPFTPKSEEELLHNEKIYARELDRLERSIQAMPEAKTKIVMTHYPPISADLQQSKASQILEKYSVNHCVFGHLHQMKEGVKMFGEKNGIRYHFTSCDYLDFKPIKIL